MSAPVREPSDRPDAASRPGGDGAASLAEWLSVRTPAPPESLRRRLLAVVAERGTEARLEGARLGGTGPADGGALADLLVDTAEWLLGRLLREGRLIQRSAALDLLAADALITYAFEAASDDPPRLVARATRAMASLAALVAQHA